MANPLVGGRDLRKQHFMKTAHKGQGKAIMVVSLL